MVAAARFALNCLSLSLLLISVPLAAGEISVNRSSVYVDEAFEITVTLEGRSASLDEIDLPIKNALLDGEASTSSEFSWVNGKSTRRKVFRFAAHAVNPGNVTIGPLLLRVGGESDLSPAVSIRAMADAPSGATPFQTLQQLEASGREKVLIVAEASRSEAYVGQQIVVTWYLYTAEAVRDFDIRSQPAFEAFWVEDLPTDNEPTETTRLARYSVQKVPIRRVALFPLRAGDLSIDSLSAVAEILVRREDSFGAFSQFNRQYVNVLRRSSPIRIQSRNLPERQRNPETDYSAIGRFSILCSKPRIVPGGPVSFDVSLRGMGNLRPARAPQLPTVNASTQVQEGDLRVNRLSESVEMSRTWKYLLFPKAGGELVIPGIEYLTFDPEVSAPRKLVCQATSVVVESMVDAPPRTEGEDQTRKPVWPRALVFWTSVAFIAVLLSLALLRILRTRVIGVDSEELRWLTEPNEPREIRARLQELIARHGLDFDGLFRSTSEQGESFRALYSLVEMYEKQSLTAVRSDKELRKRARQFLASL